MDNPKAPPHSVEAEESLLCSAILFNDDVKEAFDIVATKDFYRPSNAKIFSAIKRVMIKNSPVDLVSVSEELSRAGDLDAVGGYSGLARLTDTVPAAANTTYYAEIIRDKALLRTMILKAYQIIQNCHTPRKPAMEIIDECHSAIMDVRPVGGIDDCFFLSDVLSQRVDHYELIEKEGLQPGVMTGYRRLDYMLRGLKGGSLNIIAARPSMGKTSFCQSIAINAAKMNTKTLVFSIEMPKEQLADREITSESGIDQHKILLGRLSQKDWHEVMGACGRIPGDRILICDIPSIHVSEICRISRQAKLKHGIGMIIIDYLQLIRGEKKDTQAQQISYISKTLKALSRELNIPVVPLSQLNRNLEQRTDKRPIMSDLRESGAIEEDADTIMFIYRDEVYNTDENNPNKGKAEIIIGKNRNGPTGTVSLAFRPESMKFYDLAEGGYGSTGF